MIYQKDIFLILSKLEGSHIIYLFSYFYLGPTFIVVVLRFEVSSGLEIINQTSSKMLCNGISLQLLIQVQTKFYYKIYMGRKKQKPQEITTLQASNSQIGHLSTLVPEIQEKQQIRIVNPEKRRQIQKVRKPHKKKVKIAKKMKKKKSQLSSQSSDKDDDISISSQDQKKVWTQDQRKRYCMFTLQQLIICPRYLLSWNFWKPNHYYVKMESYVGSNNQKQCKSYDQRFKKECIEIYTEMDLLERCVMVLVAEFVKQNRDIEVVRLLRKFREKLKNQSDFNKFITKKLNESEQMHKVQEILDLKAALKKEKSEQT